MVIRFVAAVVLKHSIMAQGSCISLNLMVSWSDRDLDNPVTSGHHAVGD